MPAAAGLRAATGTRRSDASSMHYPDHRPSWGCRMFHFGGSHHDDHGARACAKQIGYCLATSGEAGIDGMPPDEARPVREREQRAAAAIVGVDTVEFLGLDAGNRWVFHDQLVDGLEPWGGVQAIWVAGSPAARHGVDVTDTFERGLESLRAHEAYLRGLSSGDFDPGEFLESFARSTG